jgi:cell division protein FtsN
VALNLAGFFESSPPEAPTAELSPAPPPSDQITDQVALQVAAYLKQDYALKRVEDLKQKGLNAYWVETASGGKTWYQVRIAPFRDQSSAREFGRSLKSKGIIDDFYVTSAGR